MLNSQRRASDGKPCDAGGATPQQTPFSAPAIPLAKGAGAIRGIGEKFAANPVTGSGSLSVPLYTSPGRSGFGPQLSLSYDSGAGNERFSLGGDLSFPSITRKTDKGWPRCQNAVESDVFVLSGVEDLVAVFQRDCPGNWVRDDQGRLVFDEVEPATNLIEASDCPKCEVTCAGELTETPTHHDLHELRRGRKPKSASGELRRFWTAQTGKRNWRLTIHLFSRHFSESLHH